MKRISEIPLPDTLADAIDAMDADEPSPDELATVLKKHTQAGTARDTINNALRAVRAVESSLASAQAIKREFSKRVATLTARLEGFRDHLGFRMKELSNDKPHRTELGNVSRAKKSIRLKVTEKDDIPEEWRKPRTGFDVNVAGIKAYILETGDTPDGVTARETFSITIYG